MNFNPSTPHRRSLRLNEYDYTSPGAYFVTLVSWNRTALFGTIHTAEINLNPIGEIVRQEWEKSPSIRQEIELDVYAIQPDHFHAIFWILPIPGVNDSTALSQITAGRHGPKQKSVGALIAGFKSATTKRVNIARKTPGVPLWQANYYEHVIRSDHDLDRIREYILLNPERLELLK